MNKEREENIWFDIYICEGGHRFMVASSGPGEPKKERIPCAYCDSWACWERTISITELVDKHKNDEK